MGSRTFQDMMAYWPVSSEPFADPMNQIPKMVFSRSTQQGAPASDAALTTAALQDATRRRSADSTRAHAAAAPPPPPPPPPPGASWSEARVARGELSEEVARLKNEPGKDILAHGGAGFAQSLVALRLVDEYRLLVHPVAIGRGHSLFASLAKPLDLRLVDIRAFASGVVAHVYRPD
jgi:dihydrofolate reductase